MRYICTYCALWWYAGSFHCQSDTVKAYEYEDTVVEPFLVMKPVAECSKLVVWGQNIKRVV